MSPFVGQLKECDIQRNITTDASKIMPLVPQIKYLLKTFELQDGSGYEKLMEGNIESM
jgi:hypothetical protein